MNIQAPIIPIEPPRGSEIERFSATLESVYDCVLEPDNWQVALAQINALTGADSAAFHWGDIPTRTAIETYHIGMSPEMLGALRQYSIYWAMQVDAINWKVGTVYHLPDLLSREEFENGRFYREVIVPHRQCDYMGINPVNDGQRLAALSVNTSVDRGVFQPRSVELLRLLAPHITKAAKLSAAFDLKTLQSKVLEKTLDTLSSGVLLLNAQGQAIYSNAAAQRMLHNHSGIRLAQGKLVIKQTDAEDAFKTSLAALREPARAAEQPPATIAIPNDTTPLIITVLPIETGRRKGLMGAFEATVAVFIQNMTALLPIPSEALNALYGFTPAETKVTMALLQGFSTADIADILGITEGTVRSHIKSVFAKTGTARQAELVQMLMRAMSPVAG
jgi:DNA-binding CsgD family transcriptional regulator/PAS domain-containing protein